MLHPRDRYIQISQNIIWEYQSWKGVSKLLQIITSVFAERLVTGIDYRDKTSLDKDHKHQKPVCLPLHNATLKKQDLHVCESEEELQSLLMKARAAAMAHKRG